MACMMSENFLSQHDLGWPWPIVAPSWISVPVQRLRWGETLQPGAHLSPTSITLHLNTKLFYLYLRWKLFSAYLLAEKQSQAILNLTSFFGSSWQELSSGHLLWMIFSLLVASSPSDCFTHFTDLFWTFEFMTFVWSDLLTFWNILKWHLEKKWVVQNKCIILTGEIAVVSNLCSLMSSEFHSSRKKSLLLLSWAIIYHTPFRNQSFF